MPKMNGLELLKSILASPYYNNVDVVLFTGYGKLDSAIQALRLGVFDYLLKPLDVRELANVTEKIAKRRKKVLNKINIMLVHNNSIFAEGLKYIFTRFNSFNLIGEAKGLLEAFPLLEAKKVDIILVDVDHYSNMQGTVADSLKELFPKLNIAVLYSHQDLITENIKKQAPFFISKDKEGGEIMFLLEQVYKGDTIPSPFLEKTLSEAEKMIQELTCKEYEVLKLLGQGLTNKEIAECLYLSHSTARTYVSRIFQKLNVANRTAAAALAVKHLDIEVDDIEKT